MLNIRRLGWAGMELSCSGATAVIDLLEDLGTMRAYVGEARTPLPPPSAPVDLALLTHLHDDHCDVPALARRLAPGAVVLRPEPVPSAGLLTAAIDPAEAALAASGLDVREVAEWETVQVGPFACTAVPAVDGFGDPQVGWVVEAGGRRVGHFGDTLFHGMWWRIAQRCAPLDAAFLPVNAPVCDFPHRRPSSGLPAVMDPRQAAAAASVLRAGLAVPMHYEAIHAPPVYDALPDAGGAFAEACAELGVACAVPGVGEEVELLDPVGAA
jgi:L-ascorbate metabolism protein UlaG (beta-lactamase superfamily)